MKKRYPHKYLGFSLIELLVVLSVLAILFFLIISYFNKAQENAHRTACISNLHKIGIANLEYATDHEGRSVSPNSVGRGESGGKYWNQVLANFVGIAGAMDTMGAVGFFGCPAGALKEDNFTGEQAFFPRYGMSYYPYDPYWNKGAPPKPDGISYVANRNWMLSIAEHGEWVMVMDAPNFKDCWGSISSQRHSGGAHYLRYDGYVFYKSYTGNNIKEDIRNELLRKPTKG